MLNLSEPEPRSKSIRTEPEQSELFDRSEMPAIVNVASVPQRSPFRYPGGKTWLIPTAREWLSSLSGQVDELIEPFAGGGGISLAAAFEGLVRRATLVELDPDVASVWAASLSESAEDLASRIRNFHMSEQSVHATLGVAPDDLATRAFQTILRNRVSRGGILAPGAGLIKQGEAGKGLSSRWYPETLARRIEAIYEHRAKIGFVEGDGLAVMRKHALDPSVAYFVDPPYPVAGRRLYRFHEVDHRGLFEVLASLKGPFLATYDHNEDIDKLAQEFGFQRRLIPMKSTHHTKKLELLIGRDLGWLKERALPSEFC